MGARTIYSVLEASAHTYGNAPALHQPIGKGQYQTYSWADYKRAVEEIACGLRRLGVGKGDIVALYAETRAEFYLADLGIMSNGSIAAALYTSYPLPDQIGNLRTSDAKAIFVEDPKSMQALMDAAGDVPLPVRWILLTGEAGDTLTLEQLRAEGRLALSEDAQAFEKIRAGVNADDLAILYLTSGATGEPKMGLVTHAALVANVDAGPTVLPLLPTDSTIGFLPSAHIAQRIVIELLPARLGVTVWFSESLAKLPNELKTIRPTFLLAPPRVWERIFASVSAEITQKSALRLLFSKVHARLGGRLRIVCSGAAPLGKELARFYAAIGLPLIEGYGLTEGGVVCLNPLDRPKSGSIGVSLPETELRLAEDGELLVKSPALFSGYYKDPASTAAVLRDGWVYCGDLAEIDPDGYVYITGRKKA